MIIRIDSDNNIIQYIKIGGNPDNPDCYEVSDIPSDVAEDIFSYKYIDGQFIRRSDTDTKHVKEAKAWKSKFLNETCASIIESGVQIEDDHYSLTYADQINLSKLSMQATVSPTTPIFYHADGKLCRQYTTEEFMYIAQICVSWVTYHTTYTNFAKMYINSLHDFNQISNFKYGMRLSDELEVQLKEILDTTHIIFDRLIDDPFNYDEILYPNRNFQFGIPSEYLNGGAIPV